MSTTVFRSQVSSHTVDAISGDSARGVVVDSVHKNLTSVKIPSADRYNDQSRKILQQYIHLLPVEDLKLIEGRLNVMNILENKLAKNPSWFRKKILTHEYQRVSKETYFIVKTASNRIIDGQLRDQIRIATDPQEPASPATMPAVADPPTSTSNPGHPFKSRGRSALALATFHNVERVDLTTLQSRATGDPLVFMELHERNQRTQRFVAALQPFPPPDDNMTDAGSESRLLIPDTAEMNKIDTSEVMGPPSETNGKNNF